MALGQSDTSTETRDPGAAALPAWQRRLLCIGGGAILAVTAVAAFVIVQLHAGAVIREQDKLRQLGVVLSEQTGRSFQAVDVELRAIRRELLSAGMVSQVALQHLGDNVAMHDTLARRSEELPQIEGIALVGADGRAIANSKVWPMPPRDVAAREYMRHFNADMADLPFFSDPAADPYTGAPTIFIARPIRGADGKLLAVLVAAAHLTYFQNFYRDIAFDPGTSVSLLRRDGLVLVRYSTKKTEFVAPRMPEQSPWYRMVKAGGGNYWSPGYLGDGPRLVTVHPVHGMPLVISVGLARAEAMAGWRVQAVTICVAAVVVILGLALLLRTLATQFGKAAAAEVAAALRNVELEAAHGALQDKSNLLETTLANMDQGLIMVGADRKVEVYNDRVLRLLELPDALMAAHTTFDEVVAYQAAHHEFDHMDDVMQARLRAGRNPTEPMTFEVRRKNGVHVEVRVVPLAGGGQVRTFTDVTERIAVEATVRHAAAHDPLTGLANRASFSQALDDAVAAAAKTGVAPVVLYLDLDRFKPVNDTLGHRAGDALLRHVAARLQAVVRSTDTLGRLGGDEFAVVLVSPQGLEAAIAMADRMLHSVRQPYMLQEGRACIGLSIGIAALGPHGDTGDALIRHADLALYRAKASGRNTRCMYSEALDMAADRDAELESDLQTALQEGRLALNYQPIWDVVGDAVAAVETLARWSHPRYGAISPTQFIPLAERSGLIVPLGHWVLETACREALTWANPVEVAVNVTASQLRRPEMVGELRDVLARTGLPASRLCLEVTESQLLEQSEDVRTTMTAICALGVRLALDDFGTGYSSLAMLRAFPFSSIKIDRSFTQGDAADTRARGLLETIVQLSRVMGLSCVAEGVETDAQLALVRSLGCSHAQGFLLGQPEPPQAIRELLWQSASGRRQADATLDVAALASAGAS